MTTLASIDQLRSRYPWPHERPEVGPADWAMDGGGRELITDLIVERQVELLLEIGSYLGDSTKRWLLTSPQLVVIAVDPWSDETITGASREESARQQGRTDLCGQFSLTDGFYHTFLANMWDFRDRLIPVRGAAPKVLHDIHATGVEPDLVYLDADKSGREIEVCHRLFPEAIITGDDWEWGAELGYPIRRAVKQFCMQNAFNLKIDRQTWVIDEDSLTWRDHLRHARARWRKVRRGLRSLVSGRAAC